MDTNEILRQRLHDLGRTLAEAISDSSEASRTLRLLRREGYSVFLELVDPDGGDRPDTLTVSLKRRPADREGGNPKAGPRANPQAPGADADPSFQIQGHDLAFLRSIGIDPTRKSPKRRR